MKIRPLHDWVVLEAGEEEERSPGGIIIPDVAKGKPQWGVVISAGPGAYEKERGKKEEEEKKLVSTEVKPGDRVLYEKYMAKEFELDGRKITMVREAYVLGLFGAGGERRTVPEKKGTTAVEKQRKGTTALEKPAKKSTALEKTRKPVSKKKTKK